MSRASLWGVAALLCVSLWPSASRAWDGYDCQDEALMASLAEQAKLDPQGGGRIQALSLECGGEACATEKGRTDMLMLIDVCVGAPDDRAIIEAIRDRLRDTGFFGRITVDVAPVEGGSEVAIKAEAATLVRSVSYSGNAPLLESDIEKRLQLRRGSLYVSDKEVQRAQKVSVAALYQQEGYYNTKVKISATPVEGTHTVDVKVEITKGTELEIERVIIGGHNKQSYNKIRGTLLEPIGWLGTFTEQKLKQGLQDVLESYRALGYYRARIVEKAITPKVAKGLVEIRLEIDEGPRWKLTFLNNKRFTPEELAEQVTFAKSGYVDKVEIAKTVDGLKSLYETSGHYFAKVEAHEPPPTDPEEREIVFTITEGKRAEIRSIAFVGNEVISDEELTALIGTKPYGLFASGGFLQRAEMEADLSKIVSAYQARGYLKARVPRWELAVGKKGETLRLRIFIEEGRLTKVREVLVPHVPDVADEEANKDGVTKEQLLARLASKPDNPFSMSGIQSDRGTILKIYHALGFPNVRVDAKCRSGSESEWAVCNLPQIDPSCFGRDTRNPLERCTKGACEGEGGDNSWCCAQAKDEPGCGLEGGIQSDKVDIRLDIDEGPRMTISALFLRGNFRTQDSVIWDELPPQVKAGETFLLSKVFEGQSNLRSLGLFESVTIKAIGKDIDAITKASASNRVALVVVVEESAALFFDLRVGGESRNLLKDNASFILTVETAFVNNNVWGSGRGLQFKLKSAIDLFEFVEAFSVAGQIADELGNLDFLLATEAVFFAPRSILLRSEVALTFFYTLDLLGVEDSDLDKEEGGARVSARKTLKEYVEGLSIQVSLEQRRFTTRSRIQDPRNRERERLFSPLLDITKLSLNPTLDRRNSKLNPTRGYIAEVSAEVAVDAGDLLDSNRAFSTAFIKTTATWSRYWTFFGTLTWAYGLRLGAIVPLFSTETIPPDELFRLGGTSTMRGFRDDGVGPLLSNFEPRGGELLGLAHTELRYPLLKDADLFGAAFMDAGLLVDCREPLAPGESGTPARLGSCFEDLASTDPREQLRTSAGIGIRWLVLGQIPLIIDYGLVLNRRFGEDFGDLHIGVGYIF